MRNMVAIQVPEGLYKRLERLAQLTNRPLESLVVQALNSGLPPVLADLPATMQNALLALEQRSDAELEAVAREHMSDSDMEQFAALRERQRVERISDAEQQALSTLMQQADLRTLRKAYATVLLKWRGRLVPVLTDLDEYPKKRHEA